MICRCESSLKFLICSFLVLTFHCILFGFGNGTILFVIMLLSLRGGTIYNIVELINAVLYWMLTNMIFDHWGLVTGELFVVRIRTLTTTTFQHVLLTKLHRKSI